VARYDRASGRLAVLMSNYGDNVWQILENGW